VNAPQPLDAIVEAIPAAAIASARAAASASGRGVPELLAEQLGLDAQALTARLAATFRYPCLPMAALHALHADFSGMPFSEALRHHCVPLIDDTGARLLAIADPFDTAVLAHANRALDGAWQPCLAHLADIDAYLARQEEGLKAMDSMRSISAGGRVAGGEVEDLSIARIAEDASPVVRLARSTLYDALKIGASDIHLESDAQGLTIKYRIDGVLSQVGQAAGADLAEQVISRIKVMSELDIAERRVPQDGRFKVTVSGREVDLRVSIMPSVYGEDAVLRILDRRALSEEMRGLSLETLGFQAGALARIRKLAAEPYGMLLVTGPTGSGKTTTLYAAISEINTGRDKIITIEDPVEYQLPGVLQIPVNEKKGLTFARGLRSILRHDPDKIMVGEIRDPETAQIAVQSALTGHLVLTTVHANNVFDVIGRFMHMGVDPYSFVSALNGVVAQRLLRVNCTHCTAPTAPDAQLLIDSGLAPEAVADWKFSAGRGCGHCRGTGYKGRRAVAELMNLTDEIRELIVAREPIRRVKEAARAGGTRSLREAALDLVAQGATTLEEVNRVTFVA
jgi:general secretion pathway protein E